MSHKEWNAFSALVLVKMSNGSLIRTIIYFNFCSEVGQIYIRAFLQTVVSPASFFDEAWNSTPCPLPFCKQAFRPFGQGVTSSPVPYAMALLQPMLLTSLALPRALPIYLAWDDLNALKLCDMALQRSDLLAWKPLDGLVHLTHAMRLRPHVYGELLHTWLRLSQGVFAAYDLEGQQILIQLRTIIQATLRVLAMDCPVHHTRRTLQLAISPGQYQQMLNCAHLHPRVINSPAADDDAGDLFLRATEQLWILWYTLPDFVHLLTFLRSTLLHLRLLHRELKSWAMPRAWRIP